MVTRVRARVAGTVQGVGFRPFVYRLAIELGVSGYVMNDSRGVVVEAEADEPVLERFLERLGAEAPPLARIARLDSRRMAQTGGAGFEIRASAARGGAATGVAPDAAVCEDCLTELLDPTDRRFRYPFINCTACGPRFTIVRGLPYDRARTTMAAFEMCPACRAEYEDPGDRRFHAQPNACPACGPHAWLAEPGGRTLVRGRRDEAVIAAARALDTGAIVAVKGLGGFHLACRADDESVVAALRTRKLRVGKPFAVMVADVRAARRLCTLEPCHEALLCSSAAPIVLAPRRGDSAVAPSVAPRLRELGLILPYTPLHHLLIEALGRPLVMTSGNRSDEPIAHRDDDALARLGGIADLFLLHDRPIEVRAEDSVARVCDCRPVTPRRSRGYAPAPLALPVHASRPVLAVGAQLKSTFCLARGTSAWISHHLGDLDKWETLSSFREGIAHFERLFEVQPEVVACDLHPDYQSSAYAHERHGCEVLPVQHHHAHLAACLAEHGHTDPAVGAIYDGFGLGCDGLAWGGELLVGDLGSFRRAGHLRTVALPGGDRAAREPWRMACSWLCSALEEEPPLPPRLQGAVEPGRWSAVARLALGHGGPSRTTSAGRLFDAIAALAGFGGAVHYEGQAAIELQAVADLGDSRDRYPLPVACEPGAPVVLDARATVLAAASDAQRGADAAAISARFHHALAAATAEACALVAAGAGLDTVVLSGGVFQNARLLSAAAQDLLDRGLRVLTPSRVPAGDGGISYGQAAVAASRKC